MTNMAVRPLEIMPDPALVEDDPTYVVRRSRLEGEVTVSGAKNSVLRLMAASLLSEEPVVLRNYPSTLLDARVHLHMLDRLGKSCAVHGDTLTVEEVARPGDKLNWEGRSIRNTLLILGALTARTGAGEVPIPGGCKLGERKHDLHVMLLEALGATVTEGEGWLRAEAPKGGLVGADIRLPIRSTGATENAIICATLARGKTTIWGPHIRPEIIDLIRMLRQMGADIRVYGQERIEVIGKSRLRGADYTVLPDNLEALTWMVGAAITGGTVEIKGFPIEDLLVPLAFMKESGVRYFIGDNSVIVQSSACYPIEIATGPYPGINSDMQPLFAVFGAMSKGVSKIVDLRFPGRYGYAEELRKMGVWSRVNGDVLVIDGGATDLSGAEVRAVDLRAGIALTLAGFAAAGETRITDAWQVERGYDRFVEKLAGLGANVERSAA